MCVCVCVCMCVVSGTIQEKGLCYCVVQGGGVNQDVSLNARNTALFCLCLYRFAGPSSKTLMQPQRNTVTYCFLCVPKGHLIKTISNPLLF